MPPRLAVIICGSRKWDDEWSIELLVRELSLRPELGVILIHGDAPGADSMAGAAAEARGLTVLPMPAQWDRYGRAAGPKRNEAMLDVLLQLRQVGYEVEVHAFPKGESRGTRGMIRLAKQAGVKVYVND